jgi:hypothetical protein
VTGARSGSRYGSRYGRLLLGVALLAGWTALAPGAAAAEEPVSVAAARQALPDPRRYNIVLRLPGAPPQALETIRRATVRGLGTNHFYGAVAAQRREDGGGVRVHVRGGLHSVAAAERSAMRLCESEAEPGDPPCRIVGRVLPAGWQEGRTLELSAPAVAGFGVALARIGEPPVVARSAGTTGWAIWGGPNARRAALDECNGKVQAGGFEPDCALVIADPG